MFLNRIHPSCSANSLNYFIPKMLLVLMILTSSVQASEQLYKKANSALAQQNYEEAFKLFKKLESDESLKKEAIFGLAKTNLFVGKLDDAEDYIEKLLKHSEDNPEYLFIAGRIAGKQAQAASIFTKLGYAKDTKKYFTKALEIEGKHKPSLVGLIRFHQQAPVMAGGDKESIPELLNKLRGLDRREAFAIEAPLMLSKKKIDETLSLYKKALYSDSDVEIGEFRFNFAMMLSNQGLYRKALEELSQIELSRYESKPSFYHMSFYQIAKTAAESESRLELGLKSIKQYAKFTVKEKTIPADWIKFRTIQLSYLLDRSLENRAALVALEKETSDKDLKNKVKKLLKDKVVKENS